MKVRLNHRRLGEELARSRLSQNHWALRMGLSRGHLSNLVNGKHRYPRAETRELLLKTLRLPFEALFEVETGSEPPVEEPIADPRLARQDRQARWAGADKRDTILPSKRGQRLMMAIWNDIRYSLRSLARTPGFTAAALAALAVGIGANTAIFSVIDGVLLHVSPYPELDRLVTVWQDEAAEVEARQDVSIANYIDWSEGQDLFEIMAAVEPYSMDFTGKGEPESFLTGRVTRGFFRAWGVPALYGRTFLEEEFETGAQPAVVLSYGLWQRRFGRAPDIVGQRIALDNQETLVAGVMPEDFRPRILGKEQEIWAPRPLSQADRRSRGANYYRVVGRLKDSATVQRARAALASIAERLERRYPGTNSGSGVQVIPYDEYEVGGVRGMLLIMVTAVAFVLLIACVNVAHLLLARNTVRAEGFAVRAALGAGRARLARQLFIEAATLGVFGGLIGLVVAWGGIQSILALSPSDVPRIERVGLNWQVLLFTLAASLTTALLFGAIPALRFSSPNLRHWVSQGGRLKHSSSSAPRLRSLLVVAEVTFAVILLVGAGLAIRSFASLMRVDPGFDVEKVVALQVHAWDRYNSPQRRAAFFQETVDRLGRTPGVRHAGLILDLPLGEGALAFHDIHVPYVVADRAAPPAGQEPSANVNIVSGDYFQAMGIRLLDGRLFDSRDHAEAPATALINETLAKRGFPDTSPIGKRITVRFGSSVEREVVGVVADVRAYGLDHPSAAEIFMPHPQYPFGSMTYVLRTTGDAEAMIAAAQNQIWDVNPTLPTYATATMEQLLDESLAPKRFNLTLLTVFAAVALLLAGTGIFGVVSFSTRQRSYEIGLRMALGAHARDISRMVVREGLLLSAVGIVLGLAGAFALTRFMRSMLFDVAATDPLTYAAIAVVLGTVATLASYLPARSASRIDPLSALRRE